MPSVVGRQFTRVLEDPRAQYAASAVTMSNADMGSGKCIEL